MSTRERIHRARPVRAARRSGVAALLAGSTLFAAIAASAASAAEGPGLGVPPSAATLASAAASIRPDGTGLPPGSGDVSTGERLYRERCLVCHGEKGENGPHDRLAGGQGSLATPRPVKTLGSYWPYATTVFDYVRRAMPYQQPHSLTDDETYAITAYLLHLNGIVPADARLDAHTLPAVRMPNRDGFVWTSDAQQVAGLPLTCHVLPDRASAPTTIALTRDGRVWFTQAAADRIGVMNPDGTGLREFPLPNRGSSPRVMSVGADGNLWFSQHAGNRIGRLTPDGVLREFTIPTPDSQPRAVALGADGNLWFGMFRGGRIGRITPDGRIREFPVPTRDSGPRAVAAGPDGNLWFSEYRGNKIGRITPDGKVKEFPLPRPASGPGDITAGADGAMWFVELENLDGLKTDGNRVGRITMDGKITEYAMPPGGGSAVNLAVGPDRNVWYTRGNRLGRVTPDGVISEFELGNGIRAVGITAGSDRQPPDFLTDRLWFADGAGGRLCNLRFR